MYRWEGWNRVLNNLRLKLDEAQLILKQRMQAWQWLLRSAQRYIVIEET